MASRRSASASSDSPSVEDGGECYTIGCNRWVLVAECQLAELHSVAGKRFAFGMPTVGARTRDV